MKKLSIIISLGIFLYLSAGYWSFQSSQYPSFIVENITYPIHKTFNTLSCGIAYIQSVGIDIKYWLHYKKSLIKKLKKTKEIENDLFKAKLDIAVLKDQLNDIKKINNFAFPVELNSVSVNVYGHLMNFYESFLTIANPYNYAIKKDSPVISEKGLIGRIIEVYPSVLKVLTITNLLSRIPVKFLNTKRKGILSGNGDGLMLLDYFQSGNARDNCQEFIPQIGDILFTSGVGGIYPPNIPVGVVEQISNQTILVRPLVEINNLKIVTILYEKNAF